MMSDCDDDATLPIQKAVGHCRKNPDFVNSNAWKWRTHHQWYRHGTAIGPWSHPRNAERMMVSWECWDTVVVL